MVWPMFHLPHSSALICATHLILCQISHHQPIQMNHNNSPRGYNWDDEATYDGASQHPQNSQHNQDEVISVYEIYVKDEETFDPDGKNDTSAVLAGLLSTSITDQIHPIQGDCVIELDETLGSQFIGAMGSVSAGKLCDREASKHSKILDEKLLPYSCNFSNNAGNPGAVRLVDKDDPRSRLHFVKYLKREGKTLKIWECGICSKEFRHQYTLMRHLPTHTDERNFKCEICGKAFRQLSTLSQHRAIHSDARPYVCEYCKKTFNRVSTLISHRKTHSDDKPHKCEMCGKGFHQKGNLRNHVFTHTNERPYKCGLCGKGFNQMSNLMCHKMKSHANVEKSLPHGCTTCGKKFLRRFALRSHEESKHGIKYPQTKPNAVIESDPVVATRKFDCQKPVRIQVADIPASDNVCNVDSVIIDAIRTKAMEDAMSLGQIPFALFKPMKGIPVLVKVSNADAAQSNGDEKQVLSPATTEDLKLAEKTCLSPMTLCNDSEAGLKEVQLKVPVVATVTQILDSVGNFNYIVEAPEPDQDRESQLIETRYSHSEVFEDENHGDHRVTVGPSRSQVSHDNVVPFSPECDIQYIRATEDGRYEMMSNTEAIDLMAQNCHDVTILNDVDVASISFDDHIVLGDSNANGRINIHDKSPSNIIMQQKNIEVFGDKDFRILDSREEKFSVDDISLLEQSKIEDFILGSRRAADTDMIIDDHDPSLSPIDSSFRSHIDPNELMIFNRRDSSGMCFLHQLHNSG